MVLDSLYLAVWWLLLLFCFEAKGKYRWGLCFLFIVCNVVYILLRDHAYLKGMLLAECILFVVTVTCSLVEWLPLLKRDK